MQPQESFSQLQLRFTDPIQHDYELIRPIVLFSQSVADRSSETEIARTTIGDKAKRFVTDGLLGLLDKRSKPAKQQEQGYPQPIANYILYLKQLYPPFTIEKLCGALAINLAM